MTCSTVFINANWNSAEPSALGSVGSRINNATLAPTTVDIIEQATSVAFHHLKCWNIFCSVAGASGWSLIAAESSRLARKMKNWFCASFGISELTRFCLYIGHAYHKSTLMRPFIERYRTATAHFATKSCTGIIDSTWIGPFRTSRRNR